MSVEVPPPPDGTKNKLGWAQDADAQAEEENWDNPRIIRDQDHKNKKWYLIVEGWIVTAFMILVCLIFGFALISWSWHFLTPGCAIETANGVETCEGGWHWLSPIQLSKIQSIIFSGVAGSFLTVYLSKRMWESK